MRRLLQLAVLVFALTLFGVTDIATARSGSDSSGTHSYQSSCEAGSPRFTNTSDPSSTGNGVIEFRAAGAALTLSPGESGVLNPGEVSPDTPWDVVFFDLGEAYVFDGGTLGDCESPTVPLPYSVSVAEGCNDGEAVVNFTNTGTHTMYAVIGMFAEPVDPGATIVAVWPGAPGELYEQFDWHAHEFPDPLGEIGPEFATGTVFLANACGVATGPVDGPDGGVVRNIGAAVPPSQISAINQSAATVAPVTGAPVTGAPVTGAPVTVAPVTVAPVTVAPVTVAPVTVAPVTGARTSAVPTPLARFEGTGTEALDLGAGLLADDELYLLDVVFTAERDFDTLIVNELDENFEDQGDGLSWVNGSFEGRFLLNGGDSTTRYLQVETEGSWTLTIWPFLSTVEQWVGGEAHGLGPDVLLFTGEPGVVSFVHRGESNFAVDFYGDDNFPEASINEPKNVDGTVIDPVSPAVVVIDADGEWWLRR